MNENNETNELIENLKQRRDEAVQQGALWTCSADELRAALDAGIYDFSHANLHAANLYRASLCRASLNRASLSDAILTGAILAGADLTGAILNRAILAGADLTGARLADARLVGADLRTAEGIMAVYLPGMSSRGDYLYLVRQNNCPARFKAGCQWLTRDELVTRVKEKKTEGSTGHDLYLLAIEFLAAAAQRLGWQI